MPTQKHTRAEVLGLLKEWQQHHDNLDAKMEDMAKLFWSITGSPFHETIWNMFSAYTWSLSSLLGDEDDWLDWYWLENGWGQRKLAAKGAEMKREKKICSLEDLALLLGFTE